MSNAHLGHVPPAAELASDFDYLNITKPEKPLGPSFNVFKTPFKGFKPNSFYVPSTKATPGDSKRTNIDSSRYSSPKNNIKVDETRSSVSSSPGMSGRRDPVTSVIGNNIPKPTGEESGQNRKKQASAPLSPESRPCLD